MRRNWHPAWAIVALLGLATPTRAESASVLLEKGIYQEETAGNLDGAMALYKQIIEQEKTARPIAAQALYRLGECHLKQGHLKEATQAFDDLKARFPDQAELVAKAGKKLASSRENMSEAQVGQLVRDAVMSISTRTEGDPEIRSALASLEGINEPVVVKALASHLDSDEANVRRSALYILWKGQFDSIVPAAEQLLKLCSHPEDFTRGMSAIALGANKVGSSFQGLSDMTLNDKSGYARRCAAYALGLLGNPQAKDVLEKALKDSDRLVGENAKTALRLLSQSTKPAEGAGIGYGRAGLPQQVKGISNESARPHVVSTHPKALANDVDPGLDRITVTFDRPMMDKSWSWTGGGETYPTRNGEISYDARKTTCAMPVKLEPGKAYFVGINSPSHRNFQTTARVPAVRYAIVFATRSADGKPTPIPAEMIEAAKRINSSQTSTQASSPDQASTNRADATALALVDAETRREVSKYNQNFADLFRAETAYAAAPADRRSVMISQWIENAQSGDGEKQAKAIASLGNVRATEAVPVLIQIAQQPTGGNRSRWLAVRALGRIGDIKAAPVLIDLVDHLNLNTRVYARLGLAEVTGVYFGTDKEKWRAWLKQNAKDESTAGKR